MFFREDAIKAFSAYLIVGGIREDAPEDAKKAYAEFREKYDKRLALLNERAKSKN